MGNTKICGHNHGSNKNADEHSGCGCCSSNQIADIFDEIEEEKRSDIKKFNKEIRFLIITGILFATCLVIEEFFQQYVNVNLLNVVFLALYLICGFPVLKSAFFSLLKGNFFNEFTLMGGASLAAVSIGQISEAVGVMIFYRLGEAFQRKASSYSRRSIKALLAQKPIVANLFKDGKITNINPKDIVKGDKVQVLPGEIIPIDGMVVSGTSQINSSAITGESKPIFVKEGSSVHGGTLSLDGMLIIEAVGPFEDSTISRMLDMVQSATARKSPTERFITRFARWYTPSVFGLAALVALLPPIIGYGDFKEWFYRGLVLLVISCPCALVISIPLGYFGGIGAASKKGILVKGANVFDALSKVSIAVFDKTGTLTYGKFEVEGIYPQEGISEKELLHTAASAEVGSNHPLAKSILAASGEMTIPQDAQLTQIAGKGMLLKYDKNTILVGSETLLAEHAIQIPSFSKNGTIVHVAKNNVYQGYIVVDDIIRKESYQAVKDLHEYGMEKVYMLTGDSESVAKSVSATLGLDGFKAELLPGNKVEALKNLCDGDTTKTIYVGDGINDGPVLVTSETGIAMGSFGSQVAVEVADVVILNDSPLKVAELLRVAQKTRSIVWQNVFMAMGVKGVFLIFGAAGVAGLWEAVFADVGVALMAILNSTRASKV